MMYEIDGGNPKDFGEPGFPWRFGLSIKRSLGHFLQIVLSFIWISIDVTDFDEIRVILSQRFSSFWRILVKIL